MSEYAVEMLNITKSYSGAKVNDDITLRLKSGEIHALLGENGAGKSTLMNILFGLVKPDSGEIYRNGEKVTINNPNDATALGIGMVHQHFRQVQCFTVLENIMLGAENVKGLALDKDTARKKVTELSEKYGLQVDPDAVIEDISVGMQQRVEILKMLYRDNEVLILDEPTAVLTVQESQELLKIMENLRNEGKALLFISHKMNEIMQVSDQCSVIRKGKYVGTVPTVDTSIEQLSEMMVGEKVSLELQKKPAAPGETVLSVRDLYVAGVNGGKTAVNGVTFDVHAGEIVTIAGIGGNGQDELVDAITGNVKLKSGILILNGEDINSASIRKRNDSGIGLIPVDRLRDAIIGPLNMIENMILKRYYEPEFSSRGVINQNYARKYTEKLMETYDVRTSGGPDALIEGLSGGNQQKAVFAREIDKNPSLLIAVQPARGVDIMATKKLHQTLLDMRDANTAVLLVSLELSEVMSLSDRILVFYEGKIAGEFTPDNVTVEELGLYMTGAKKQS